MKVLGKIKIALAITVGAILFAVLYLGGLEPAKRGAIIGFWMALAFLILTFLVYSIMCCLRCFAGLCTRKKKLAAKPNWEREFKNVFWVSSIWSSFFSFASILLFGHKSSYSDSGILFGAIFSAICSFGFVWLIYWSIIYINKGMGPLIKSPNLNETSKSATVSAVMTAVEKLKQRLKDFPQVEYEESADQIRVSPKDKNGFEVIFNCDADGNSFVFFNGWHEDFSCDQIDDAIGCFLWGLTDTVRLKVKSRGAFEYHWTIQRFEKGKFRSLGFVGLLWFPFWRKKTVRYLQNDLIKSPAVKEGENDQNQ
ncbi:MAG: hypothetical protein ACYS18_10995 [Planctomycetota bacterium]|jgi:hypothetical protein